MTLKTEEQWIEELHWHEHSRNKEAIRKVRLEALEWAKSQWLRLDIVEKKINELTPKPDPPPDMACPCCGREGKVETSFCSTYRAGCPSCRVTTEWYMTESQAISAWTRRPKNSA